MRNLAAVAIASLITVGWASATRAHWRGGGWGHHGGYYRHGCCGEGAVAAGILGGAVLGGLFTAAATAPAYGYGYGYRYPIHTVAGTAMPSMHPAIITDRASIMPSRSRQAALWVEPGILRQGLFPA